MATQARHSSLRSPQLRGALPRLRTLLEVFADSAVFFFPFTSAKMPLSWSTGRYFEYHCGTDEAQCKLDADYPPFAAAEFKIK